jgi:transcriptional regulator
MYQPPHFIETDPVVLQALMRAHPLALLITAGPGGLMANPLPFQFDPARGVKGTLLAHMAKANPQWREIEAGAPVLAVFQGENAYITPSWYQTKQETGKVVPTWNYAIVQARGTGRAIQDPEWLMEQVSSLTQQHEEKRYQQWQVSDAPEAYVAAQLKGIVGVEIEISDLNGKWKVSQNRPLADRSKVAAGLADPTEPHTNPAIAELVEIYGGLR